MKVEYKGQPHIKILQEVYRKALDTLNKGNLELLLIDVDKTEKAHIKTVIDNFERGRGVLTVLITSFVHKLHNPDQDIRLHQDNMKGGHSDREIDTKYITPFMKEMGFPAMAESGWLTRSLEQNRPYNFSYPGKITPKELKSAFLFLFDQIQSYNKNAETYLLILLAKLIEHREQKNIDLAKPTNLTISTIINYLKCHFESSYSSRGASRLPTIAIYAIYQCLIKELKRFEGKRLTLKSTSFFCNNSQTSWESRSWPVLFTDLSTVKEESISRSRHMFLLYNTWGHIEKFKTLDKLKKYIETRHAEEGGFDWISEIKDENGMQYGCSWSLEIEQIG